MVYCISNQILFIINWRGGGHFELSMCIMRHSSATIQASCGLQNQFNKHVLYFGTLFVRSLWFVWKWPQHGQKYLCITSRFKRCHGKNECFVTCHNNYIQLRELLLVTLYNHNQIGLPIRIETCGIHRHGCLFEAQGPWTHEKVVEKCLWPRLGFVNGSDHTQRC